MSQTIANERLHKRFASWDVDGSGVLTKANMQQEAANITRAFGADAGSAEAAQLNDAFVKMFDYLSAKAGVTELTEEQFSAATETLYADTEEFNSVLGPLVEGIVGLCDKNNDGQINRDEFALWMNGVGVDSAQAADAFRQIDEDADGELSLDELLDAVRAFHFGELNVELLG